MFKLTAFPGLIKKAVQSLPAPFQQPDLIHTHILAQPNWVADKFFKGTPVITTEHWTGYVNGYFKKLPLWKQSVFKRAASKATIVTVPSEALKSAMSDSLGFQANFEVVPNVIESRPGGTGSASDIPVIMTVADFHDHNKNISGSLKAMAEIDKDFRFEVIGGGTDEKELQSLAGNLGLLGNKVVFLGQMNNEQVLKKLASASFLLINSRFETFSMVAAEALLAGVPVLTTRCGGPEQFVNDQNGMLIEKDNPEVLLNALNMMLEKYRDYDRDHISAMMGSRFSMETVGEQFLSLYQHILSN